MTDQEIDEARKAADGFRGRFEFQAESDEHGHDDRLVYVPDGIAPHDEAEIYVVADLEQPVAEPIARMLNSVRPFVDEVSRLRAELGHVGPAEEPTRRVEVFGGRLVGARCECCGRAIVVGDAITFFDDEREVMHWGLCPLPDLWYTAWTYSTGERSDSQHRPVPFEVAFAEAHRWREAGGKSLASVVIRRWREVSHG